jgi:CubicO group peptidase (beta-lactamase class C family)
MLPSLRGRSVAICLGLLCLASPSPIPGQGPRPALSLAQRVDSLVRAEMTRRRIPGLQLAVVQRGRLVKSGNYGLASVQDSVPVTSGTTFTINSITKAFVGVAVMQLVEDGKLELWAPISRYVPNLPPTWRLVTVGHLLTHTSGLPNIMPGNEEMVPEGGEDSAWAAVQDRALDFAPGAHFSYNQTNYFLLGRLIDTLAGQPFTEVITQRQLVPVGMRLTQQAGFTDSRDVIIHGARGYTFFHRVHGPIEKGDSLRNVFEEFSPGLRTAAGMSSTATELARWIIALQQGQLLRARTSLTTLWTPGTLNDGTHGGFSELLNGYALGWPIIERPAHPAVAPVGGGRSALFIYPQDDLAIVILTNLQGASPESFIDDIAAVYLGPFAR